MVLKLIEENGRVQGPEVMGRGDGNPCFSRS